MSLRPSTMVAAAQDLFVPARRGRFHVLDGLAGRGRVVLVVPSDGVLRVVHPWGRSAWQTNTLAR